MNGKRVWNLFYTKDHYDPCFWVCSCGGKRRQIGSEYSHLILRVRDWHLKELDESSAGILKAVKGEKKITSLHIWKKNTVKTYGWPKYIIDNLRLFDPWKDLQDLPHLKYELLFYKTFFNYMETLVGTVEIKINNKLPKKFQLCTKGSLIPKHTS